MSTQFFELGELPTGEILTQPRSRCRLS